MSKETTEMCPKCGEDMTGYTEKQKSGWFFSIEVCTECGHENDYQHSDGNRPEDLI